MIKKYNSLNSSPSPKMQKSMHVADFQKNFSESQGSPGVKSTHNNGNGMYSVQ